MQRIRYRDKLADEPVKGKAIEKILRKQKDLFCDQCIDALPCLSQFSLLRQILPLPLDLTVAKYSNRMEQYYDQTQ